MFLALFVSTTIIQVVQAEDLAADARNSAPCTTSFSAERGPILVDGDPIAESRAVDDDYKFQRVYSNGPLYAPVTGYFTLNQGNTGLEGALNDVPQRARSTRSSSTSSTALITGQNPKGAAVEVTIDPVVQQAAWDALGDYTGAVSRPTRRPARILAMVSKPTYDPNSLAVHDSAEVMATYDGLLADPGDPLFNRAIARRPEPARIDVQARGHGGGARVRAVHPRERRSRTRRRSRCPAPTRSSATPSGGTCGGGSERRPSPTRCASRATSRSPSSACELGDAAIREQAEKFGFNDEFEIPTDDRSRASTRACSTRRRLMLPSFGQGDVRVTPLQMAMVSAAIANGGSVMHPNLVETRSPRPTLAAAGASRPSCTARAISEETANTMTQMMVERRRERRCQ